jgi:hypothetical protein
MIMTIMAITIAAGITAMAAAITASPVRYSALASAHW